MVGGGVGDGLETVDARRGVMVGARKNRMLCDTRRSCGRVWVPRPLGRHGAWDEYHVTERYQ